MKTNRQILGAVIGLLLSLIAVNAQSAQLPNIDTTFDPGNLSGVVGPPNVQITEVKGFTGAAGTGFQVRVKWNAQTPSTTTLEKFEVNVTVRDSNGQSRNGSKTVAASAREATVPVPITAKPGSFDVQVMTFFIPLNIVKSEISSTVVLDKGNGFSSNGGTSGPVNPQGANDSISKVALASNTDLKGFDVQWGLRRRTQDVIEKQTKVSGTFTYKQSNQNVGTRTANATLGASARQTRLTASSAPVTSLANVKIEAAINVEVTFNLRKRIATSKSGSFPTN